MKRRFVTVDVFTDRPFGGNPLAVVLDAEGLSDDAMQAIAREFNLSETTFVLPPDDPANTARVRIFTPDRELPFAGHPNVGTAFALAREGSPFGRPLGTALRFEEIAGLVPVDILSGAEGPAGARLTAPQAFTRGVAIAAADFAPCVGLRPDDIDTASHPPVQCSAGMVFPIARLNGLDALSRAGGNGDAMTRHPDMGGHVFVYTPDPAGSRRFRARMFAPGMGIAEDPATGAAAAALAGLLGSLEAADGTFDCHIVQGVEMGRPSLIETAADVVGGRVTAVRVGGACAPVMRGEIEA
ncbi:MAG: PhzF family phenazine biosynthesis protein [Rhodospirillales bacterium CG15_BIG_FIL_POST_REV_8_21_14_020_66_15]|nr:MAG: PhzF family phenazine biosynthesis protein [Rhodospirillales bacterium CG15_BIG_FIL_POST_REV_8_21_14_020_66_15]